MYGEFIWWQGVVEDRKDPLKLGRVRVRVLGYHTDNKEEGLGIPTADLPWATPSQPITSAAMNGIGTTPLGPVEGTWVFGFFRDGKNAQDPVMIGTFGGIPEKPANPTLGFNDPNAEFPRQSDLFLPDTNRLATGNSRIPVGIDAGENAPSLKYKRKSRHKGVPTALAGDMSEAAIDNKKEGGVDKAIYKKTLWNEPNPRYGGNSHIQTENNDTDYLSSVVISSLYPYNHVRMSERGHVEEWDDTESAERLHRYHRTGTFEEIQPDGTRVVKVVGSDYEIVIGNKDVLISGACNVTIEGDCRMMIGSKKNKSDLVQEVYGDYHLHVHGDKRTKIHGNEVTEVIGDRKVVVNLNDDLFVNKQQVINITDDRTINIGGILSETITGAVQKTYLSTLATVTGDNNLLVSNKNIEIVCTDNIGISTAGNCDITVEGNFNKLISGIAKEQYEGAFHERWDGDKYLHTGADTYLDRHDAGTDFSVLPACDPTRTSSTSCSPVLEV
jgi:hypothetical protein